VRFSYYPDTDSVYIELVLREKRETKVPGRQVIVSDEIVGDLDLEGCPVGIDLY
jgi:hypothetical protein